MPRAQFEERYFEDPNFPPGLKGGDEVRGYGYYPDYFPIVEAQLATLIELTGAQSLLDAGCGKGALAAYARRDLGVTVTGADASRYAVLCARYAHGGERTVRCDLARLPFADGAFDVVWCNGVLQYFEAEAARAALAGLARAARTVVFVSNIAAAQRLTEWGRRDRLTHLYLRPKQWAVLAAACLPSGSGWKAVALPFEGESAILLYKPSRGDAFALRFVDLALERMRRLGGLARTPPTLASWRASLGR